MSCASQSPNRFLNLLPARAYASIAPHLQTAELPQGQTLFDAGDAVTRVYFPHTGVVSLIVSLSSGEMIETGMVGRDSLAGGSAALDGKISLNKSIVQIAGGGSALSMDRLRRAADEHAEIKTALIRHEQAILVQAQQSAACNISHTLEARLARWLLRCRDLMQSDSLDLTQEFISEMMGVRRTSVSIIAGTLQKAGLIQYRRGHIHIADLEGPRDASCECYETVKAHTDRLLNDQSPGSLGLSHGA